MLVIVYKLNKYFYIILFRKKYIKKLEIIMFNK